MINLIVLITLIVMVIAYYYISKKYSNKKYYILGIFIYVFLIIYYFALSNFKININIPRLLILLILHIALFEKVYKKVNQSRKSLKIMLILIIVIIWFLDSSVLPEQYFIKFSSPIDLFNYSIVERNNNIINVVYPNENSAFIASSTDVIYLKKINNKWMYENTLYRSNGLVQFYNYPKNCNLRILKTKDNTRLLEIITLTKDVKVTDEFNSSFKVIDFGNSARYYIVLDSQLQNYSLIIDDKTYKILRNGGVIQLSRIDNIN